MRAEEWKKLLSDKLPGNEFLMTTLSICLAQVDEARQILRDKGYGLSGTPIIHQVNEVPCMEYMRRRNKKWDSTFKGQNTARRVFYEVNMEQR